MRDTRHARVAIAALALASTALGDPRVTLTVRVDAQVAPAPTDRVVTVDGIRLHVVDWGNAGRQPLVLIHGLDRVARTFDPVARHFSSAYHVVAYDMRGHGDSAWDPEARYVVEDHVGDLAGIVAQMGLRNIVVWGNSTGGRVAQVFAGMRPDLVAGLIAEDVGPERPRSIADAYARRVQQEAAGWASEAELAAAVRKANPGMSQAVLEAYVQHGSRRASDGRVVWKRDPNLVKGFVETDLWRFVRNITAPSLYLLGGPKHHRGAGDAGRAAPGAAARADRDDAGAGPLPER
jgi:pimeloyl-ACP methyl ester carboxylesterase